MSVKQLPRLSAAAAVCAASFLTVSAQAQSTGSMAFTAFNADEDGWSMVMLNTIAANTTVFFSDGTATGPTAIGTAESGFSWNTGGAAIAPGTIVRFSSIDTAARAVSVGTFTAVNTTNLGLSATSETLYAFVGSSVSAPTTFVTAVSTEVDNTSLTIVGLTPGATALKLTASTDFGQYTGARNGQQTFAGYLPLLNNGANWVVDTTGDGSAVVPSGVAFTISPVPEPGTYALLAGGVAAVCFVVRRRRA